MYSMTYDGVVAADREVGAHCKESRHRMPLSPKQTQRRSHTKGWPTAHAKGNHHHCKQGLALPSICIAFTHIPIEITRIFHMCMCMCMCSCNQSWLCCCTCAAVTSLQVSSCLLPSLPIICATMHHHVHYLLSVPPCLLPIICAISRL